MHHGSRQHAAEDLRRQLGIRADQVILLTVGRLVRRKGVTWFVRHVLPHLPSSVTYLVAGEGPMADEVVRLVAELGLGNQVRLLGAVDEDDRERLLLGADMFVQPNIPVSGDMEGFGLVLLEAAMRGTTTVASGIDGIVDAVVDGRTDSWCRPEMHRPGRNASAPWSRAPASCPELEPDSSRRLGRYSAKSR